MTVSIIIPTFNRAALVGRTIESALAQSMTDVQVIVVDDGSSDNTADVVHSFRSDSRLTYVRQENLGRSMARNNGFRSASGDFVYYLDSDDTLLPNAIADHLATFADHPESGMSVAGYQQLNENGLITAEYRPWTYGGCASSMTDWLFHCFGMPSSVMHRRSWIETVGGFDKSCEICEDWDLYLRLLNAGCQVSWTHTFACRYLLHRGSSVLDVKSHRQGAITTLSKLGRQDSQIDHDLLTRALAWLEVVFAKRAAESGHIDLASNGLTQAILLDSTLDSTDGRLRIMEFWLTPSQSTSFGSHTNEHLVEPLVHVFGATTHLLDEATGRVEMGQFFRLANDGKALSGLAHVLRAVRRDPTWLLNRGVWSFLLRDVSANLTRRSH